MVRIALKEDLTSVAVMLKSLYKEIAPLDYSSDLNVYLLEVAKHHMTSKDTIYVDEELRGFFIVRDETEPMAPTLKRYNGIRVYIKPQHRHSSLLARFYKQLFQDFPDGAILGWINDIH